MYWYAFNRLLVLSLLALTLVSFQNCSSEWRSAQPKKAQIFKNSSGNGNAYDGKVAVRAPEYMSPGETVTVYVDGGAPPYNVGSDISGATIVMQSTGVYQFTLPADETGQVATIRVSDAEGATGMAQIRIWGVNKWFFMDTRGIASDDQSLIYLVENDYPALTILDSQGDIIKRLTNFNVRGLNLSDPSELAVTPDGVAYISNGGNTIVGVDTASETVTATITASDDTLWNLCGGLTHMVDSPSGGVMVSCSTTIFNFDAQGNYISEFSVNSDISNPLGAFALDSRDQVIVARQGGIVETYQSDGTFVSRLTITGKSYVDEFQPVDLEIKSDNQAVMVISESHYYTFAFHRSSGAMEGFAFWEGPGIYLGSTNNVTLLPDNRLAGATDMSNIVLGDAVTMDHLTYFGPASADPRAFYFPRSIHIDANEEITVIDNWNYRITRFNRQGQVIASNYGPDQNDRWLKHSNDVHAHSDGTIYAANTGNSRIEVIEPGGTVRTFGGNGEFNSPEGLTIGEDNLLYVADTWANRVQILDLQGSFKGS